MGGVFPEMADALQYRWLLVGTRPGQAVVDLRRTSGPYGGLSVLVRVEDGSPSWAIVGDAEIRCGIAVGEYALAFWRTPGAGN